MDGAEKETDECAVSGRGGIKECEQRNNPLYTCTRLFMCFICCSCMALESLNTYLLTADVSHQSQAAATKTERKENG